MTQNHREAGLKAAVTKGPEERARAALMAAWTRAHGKDDSKNPYSKQNCTSPIVSPSAPTTEPSVPSARCVPGTLAAQELPHVPDETLQQIERHFHSLIRSRAGDLIDKQNVTLPKLSNLVRGSKEKAWFAVPGMYGGFGYWIEGAGRNIKLISESWSRVVGGSGQRHEITTGGSVLVAEGFV